MSKEVILIDWVDCNEMPNDPEYPEVEKMFFRTKEDKTPVIAAALDSSYAAIKNQDGEWMLLSELEYLEEKELPQSAKKGESAEAMGHRGVPLSVQTYLDGQAPENVRNHSGIGNNNLHTIWGVAACLGYRYAMEQLQSHPVPTHTSLTIAEAHRITKMFIGDELYPNLLLALASIVEFANKKIINK